MKCNRDKAECDRNAAIAKQWFERTYGSVDEEGQRWIEEMKGQREQRKKPNFPQWLVDAAMNLPTED